MIRMFRFILKLYPYLRNKDCMNVLYGRLRNAEMKKKTGLIFLEGPVLQILNIAVLWSALSTLSLIT